MVSWDDNQTHQIVEKSETAGEENIEQKHIYEGGRKQGSISFFPLGNDGL